MRSNREKLLLQSQCWTNKQFDRTPKKIFRILGAPIYFFLDCRSIYLTSFIQKENAPTLPKY